MIEKLNMQAVLSANANETEYVKEALLTFDKLPVLMHELIAVELWAERVFATELVKMGYQPSNTFVIYLIVSLHSCSLVAACHVSDTDLYLC